MDNEQMVKLTDRVQRIIYECLYGGGPYEEDRPPWREEPWQTTAAQVIKEVLATVNNER